MGPAPSDGSPNGASTPATSGATTAASPAPTRSLTGSFARLLRDESPILRSTKVIILSLLALGALYAAHYGFFALHRQRYLMERNLRTLTTMSSQVEASLASARKVLDEHVGARPDSLKLAAPFIPVFDYVALVKQGNSKTGLPDSTLWRGPRVGSCTVPSGGDSLTTSWRPDLKSGGSCLLRLATPSKSLRPVRVVLNANGYLESILRHPIAGRVFDKTVLADTGGRILAQSGASDLGLIRLNVIWKAAGEKQKSSPNWADLRASPNIADADIAGSSYRVFLQPCCIDNDGVPRDAQLVLAGLVSKWGFVRESLRVPLSAFTFIVALLGLALLSWPFMRLWLLGERQRVQLSDGIRLATCALLVLMTSTIFLLDFYAYQKFRRDRDGDLAALAESILGHFREETDSARAQLQRLVLKVGIVPGDSMTPNLFANSSVKGLISYPVFESWLLVDTTGQQRRKWAVDRYVQPRISVRERTYFRNLMHRLAIGGEAVPPSGDWELESVRSWTTGKRQAALALAVEGVPVDKNRIPVPIATMALNLPSLIGVVLPPTYAFAMIDDQGAVLFHSDTSRNLDENFFAEADQDRQLRSAVFARAATSLNLTYGGLDHRAYVTPVPGHPWTLVTLRDKQPGRVLNLEMIATSVWLVILHVGLLLALAVGALVLWPRYRLPWLWPDRRQGLAYTELAVVFVLFIVAFAIALVRLHGDALLVAAGTLPLLITLIVFIRLTRREHELRFLRDQLLSIVGRSGTTMATLVADRRVIRAACRCGAVGLGLLTFALLLWKAGAPWSEFAAIASLTSLASALTLTLGRSSRPDPAMATSGNRAPRPAEHRGHGGKPIVLRYAVAATLYLLLVAVLPAAGYFDLSHAAHMGLMVKYSQLRVARAVQDRRGRIENAVAKVQPRQDPATSPSLCLESGMTMLDLSPSWCRLDLYPGFVAQTDSAVGAAKGGSLEAPVAVTTALLFPYYAETSVEWQGLSGAGAEDGSWKWTTKGRSLRLQASSFGEPLPITLSTVLPALWPENRVEWSAFIVFGVLLLLIVVAVVRFLMRRLLLVDVTDPVLVTEPRRITPLADVNLFVVCRDCTEENDITKGETRQIIDLQEYSLDGDKVLEQIDPKVRAGSPVLVRHFEHNENDPGASKAKLVLLDTLVRELSCSVTVVAGRPSGSYSRGLLGSLHYVDAELSQGRAGITCRSFVTVDAGRWNPPDGGGEARKEEADSLGRSKVVDLVESESRYDRNLREIWRGVPEYAAQMARHAAEPSYEELLDLLAERAESYYDSLWEDCQTAERLVLVHIAADGLANGKDRRILRRLLVRGLIQRRPNFVIMNETFRMYLLRHVQSVERAVAARRSVWDSVRLPAMVLLIATLGFFFMTQQDLLNLANAALAGLAAAAAGVTHVVNLVSKRQQKVGA